MHEPELKQYRGKWAIVWLDEEGRTRRRSLRTEDHHLAQRRFDDEIAKLAGPVETCGDIVALYLAEKDHTAADPERLHNDWKQLQSTFEAFRPDQVTKEKCRAYTEMRRAAGRKNGTIRHELSMLKTALAWHDPRNEASFDIPPAGAPKERYLTKQEFQQLLDAAKAPHIRLYLILAISTAGRNGALLDLTWTRVSFERNQIRLATDKAKTKKGRATVPMTKALRAALEEAQKAALTPYVIEYAGARVTSVKKGIASAAKRAGLEGVSPHVLRHSAAVWMAESRVPMPEISQYLGHTNTSVTERVYARFSPDYLSGAAQALEI